MERKFSKFGDFEVKLDALKGTFEGYASVFGGVDSYKDTVVPGAYKDTLANRDKPVAMYFNHVKYRPDMPARIGNYRKIEEDTKGLFLAGALTPNHPCAEACKASMADGTLSGLSIGYCVPEGGSEKINGVRHLKKIDLYEVSLVDDPADAAAQIDRTSIKSMLDELNSKSDIEHFLRDVGQFSREAAKAVISRFQTVILRDADEDGAKKELTEMLRAFNLNPLAGVTSHDHGKQN